MAFCTASIKHSTRMNGPIIMLANQIPGVLYQNPVAGVLIFLIRLVI
jgi:hypothetical protein